MPHLTYHATVLASLLDAGLPVVEDINLEEVELPYAARLARRGEGYETTFNPRDESPAFAALWGA
jgi:hypothetical protein